jgi:hypothetical protein
MRSPIRLTAVALVALVVAGCSTPPPATPGTASPSAPASDAGSPSAPASPSADPSADPSSAPTTEPIPSDELEPFSCDLPIHVDATTGRALIRDVRIGTHDGYDRVVFEFEGGLPEASLDRAEPPFVQDGSGLPIDVEGSSFLRLTMRGGTKQQEDGNSSYDGPTDFDPGHPALVHLVEAGDFEAQSTWFFGLNDESCVRVLTLDDEPRLVIDIEH